jgi:hypothetical protein
LLLRMIFSSPASLRQAQDRFRGGTTTRSVPQKGVCPKDD